MDSAVICTSGGVGDQIEGLKCAHYIPKSKKVKIYSFSRDEVFHPLKHLFGDQFDIEQLPEKYAENYQILYNKKLADDIRGGAAEFYYIVPDLLHRGPYPFDYKKYSVSLPVIKSTRLLLHKFEPRNEIYLGLMSTTPGYLYEEIVKLAVSLAKSLSGYIIHLPILTKWAGQDILIHGLPIQNKPENLIVYYNPDFIEQLEIQRRCCYGIYTCNGVSHTAFHFGQPRILLDPQFKKCPWIARWKENPDECINIQTPTQDVIDLIRANLNIPQTMLLPHRDVMKIIKDHKLLKVEPNWGQILILKF